MVSIWTKIYDEIIKQYGISAYFQNNKKGLIF